jgi:hypothetical protein
MTCEDCGESERTERAEHFVRHHRFLRDVYRWFDMFIVLLAAFSFVSFPIFAASQEQRIRLKPGENEASVRGLLSPKKDEARYVIHAVAGQRLTVELTGPGPLSGEIVLPSGRSEGSPGAGAFFDQKLTESGDYRIRVSEGTRAEKRKSQFILKIRLR